MDWRFSFDVLDTPEICDALDMHSEPGMRWHTAVLVLGLMLTSAGCGQHAVRASEKEFLADRVMTFDHDEQEAAADEHVITNREGSTGGRGTSGGGCGCN